MGSVGCTEGLWPSRIVGGFHGGSVVFTEGLRWSQRVRGCQEGCAGQIWSVVLTRGPWFPHGVCGFHRGAVVFTEGPRFSRRACDVHRAVVFTEGMGCSQRVCSVHNGSVVFPEGLLFPQRVCDVLVVCVVNMMSSERQVTYFGSDTNL